MKAPITTARGQATRFVLSRLLLMSAVFVCCSIAGTPVTLLAQKNSDAEPAKLAASDPSVVWPDVIPPASSHHVLKLENVTIPYTAKWSSLALKNSAGDPEATISWTSYVREDTPEPASRPVIFAFNGGPGASSSPLHFGILGPRRLPPSSATGNILPTDNPQTLLDVADLVMIDPVGTGFSRELRAGGGRAYWSPAGDANATEAVIRNWLRDNDRKASPVYIAGESFGGYRLAVIAKDIGDLNTAGLILVSPATDMSSEAGAASDEHFVFTLPSMAATAFAHKKNQTAAQTVEQVYEQARSFAQTDYVEALQLGSELKSQDRDRLAARMSALIGLPASTISAANLRIDTQDFLEQLVPDMVVGRIDTRVAAPKPGGPLVAGRSKAADDPALHMGASNIIKNARVRDYLRNEVGVKTDLDYVSLTLDVNFAWNWNAGSPKIEDNLRNLNPTPNLTKLMKEKPACRLLLLSGYYDLATPVLSQRYALTHAGVPLDRTTMVAFAAGHSVYEDDSRTAVSKELHDFIAKGTTAPAKQ